MSEDRDSDELSHSERYEGWRNYDPLAGGNGELRGTVERFDKVDYRWRKVLVRDVPDRVIERKIRQVSRSY